MKDERAYLEHILRCCQRIKEDCAAGRDAVFESHTLQDALLRNLQVLCESAQRLTPETKSAHGQIPWNAISGMRNVLVHDYFDIDFEVIWMIVVRDLPVLEAAIRHQLGR
ncbi:MAG: DUF86 domain-containing protein [Candidatus Solibacter usitatus]|nr:DUF86 domain-containing protein [Candidatus Solibacter usitatus]